MSNIQYAKSGSTVHAWYGSTVHAESGSTVRAESGSTVRAWSGSTVRALLGSTVHAKSGSTVHAAIILADDGQYKLFKAGDLYFAGCASFLTLEQALKRWDRDDDRALLFTFAIQFSLG